jgi:uncharacterized membrane protein
MKRWIAVVIGIGFLHRLAFLGARQLWTDELMQARIIHFASPSEILSRLRGGMDLASPLDFLIQRGITFLLGDAPWAMRLHAAIFGTLAIWLFYRIARFLFGERVALYSAVLFAFFPLTLHYSQEARPYSLLVLLSLLSYDVLLRQLQGKDRPWQGWLLVAGVSSLLLYTSYLGALILFSQFVGLVILAFGKQREEDRQDETAENWKSGCITVRRPQILFFLTAVLLALALFYPWIGHTWKRPDLAPVSEIADPKLILRLIKELGDNSYPIAGLLLIGAITGGRALVRHKRRSPLILLLTWFLVPIPALLLVEIWAGYFFAIRHILHATPPLVFLAGYGLSHVGERLSILPHLPYQTSSPAIAFAALLILGTVWVGQVHAHSEPADWLGLSNFLGQTVREGDKISIPGVYPLLEYYHPELAAYRVDDLDPGQGSLARNEVSRRIVACYDKMWPDPCGIFRTPALKDPVWMKRTFAGFTVFMRSK